VDDVVHDYLKCGDMKEGFARIRCTENGLLFPACADMTDRDNSLKYEGLRLYSRMEKGYE
jgi:hypothetical protein